MILDLNGFSAFARSVAQEISQQHVRELEEKQQELATRVAQATLEELKSKIEADIEELKKHLPTAEKDAWEASLDLKYLQTRQMIFV